MSEAERLGRAAAFAARAHSGQTRKSSGVPYVCHPLGVASLVIEHGGDLEQAIAGLLHDVLEDTPVTAEELSEAFGLRVLRIVEGCSDTFPGDTPEAKAPWQQRKQRFLEGLAELPPETLLVIACDKLHNLRAWVGALRLQGRQALRGFKGSPAEQVAYYEEALRQLEGRVPVGLAFELGGQVEQLSELLLGDALPG